MDTGEVKGQRRKKRAEKALRRKPAYLVFSGVDEVFWSSGH